MPAPTIFVASYGCSWANLYLASPNMLSVSFNCHTQELVLNGHLLKVEGNTATSLIVVKLYDSHL